MAGTAMKNVLARPLTILAVAALARIALVFFAPGEPTGDGVFYHIHAFDIANGDGYLHVDRSPANTWMPGWPYLLGSLYALVGVHAKAGMLLCAALGSLTALGTHALGTRCFGPRAGVAAGWLYALWPGVIYFSATLFTESLFGCLLIWAVVCLHDAVSNEAGRLRSTGLAGLLMGGCALVKAEPMALWPALSIFAFTAAPSRAVFVRVIGPAILISVLLVIPWTIRNWVEFDRFIPTSAGGGMIIWESNRPGAEGGNDLVAVMRWQEEHAADLDTARKNIAMNDVAWAEARAFWIEQPREALALVGRKLFRTYVGDSAGADLIRGHFGPEKWFVSAEVWRALALVANAWWWTMFPLVFLGIAHRSAWRPGDATLFAGLFATWFAIHGVFLGGMRFHYPEVAFLACLAGLGSTFLTDIVSQRWRRS